MKAKRLLPVLALALVSLLACNAQESEPVSQAESQPAQSQPAGDSQPQSQQQSQPAGDSQQQSQPAGDSQQQSQPAGDTSQGGGQQAHVHDMQAVAHTQGEGEVAMDVKKCKDDAYYEATWDADDAAATKDGFTSRKLSDVGKYVEYKIWVPAAMNARLYANAKYNTSNIKGIDSSEHHTVWYDWRANKDSFKVKVYVNGTEVDQATQTVKVGEQDVSLKDLNFDQIEGYTKSSSDILEFPWVNVQLNEGVNTIKLERAAGYGHTYQTFVLKTNLAQ